MAADSHRELRELIGSFAVGALSPDEAARLLAHLDGCRECRELLAELTPVAAALAVVDPEQAAAEAPLPAPIEPLLAHVHEEVGRRRRRRLAGSVVAVAAAVLLALVVVSGGDPPVPTPEERPLRSARAGVSGSVALLDRFWGTQMTLAAEGLPEREAVVIWIQRRSGERVAAGTLYGLGARRVRAELAASVRVRDAVAVGVSDEGGRVLLSGPASG